MSKIVSVIIPTFNEEKNLPICLRSLQQQDYPQDSIQVLVVDDGSTDKTVLLAKKFGAQVIHSGFKHIERSKSLGLEKARGEYILLIDADITLMSKDWLSTFVTILDKNPRLTGAQNIYWHYSAQHSIYNRYCELFGINDPFVFMLEKRGILGPHESQWPKQSVILKDQKTHFVAQFTPDNLPTLGSQGYLTRKELILKHTHWKPYFFHLDTVAELVAQGHDTFALVKKEVEHKYVDSLRGFYKKLARNIVLFLQYRDLRSYTYEAGSLGFITTVVLMMTVVYPTYISIKGFVKKPDAAWFLHPLFCFTVPILYTYMVISWKVKELWKKS